MTVLSSAHLNGRGTRGTKIGSVRPWGDHCLKLGLLWLRNNVILTFTAEHKVLNISRFVLWSQVETT